MIPWRTEMAIRSTSDLRLVGVVDALFVETNSGTSDGVMQLHMKDWKYSAGVSTYLHEYSLQMNIYKYILESTQYTNERFMVAGVMYTGIHIVSMELVVFHETSDTYAVYGIEDDQRAIETRMHERKKCIMGIK
jgi:hypothetical protein